METSHKEMTGENIFAYRSLLEGLVFQSEQVPFLCASNLYVLCMFTCTGKPPIHCGVCGGAQTATVLSFSRTMYRAIAANGSLYYARTAQSDFLRPIHCGF